MRVLEQDGAMPGRIDISRQEVSRKGADKKKRRATKAKTREHETSDKLRERARTELR